MRRADESDITPLLRMLENLRRQTRRWIWVESLALIGLLSATVFWGLLLLDWSIEPPVWVRILLTTTAFIGFSWIVVWKLLLRLYAPLTDGALAIVIERGHAGFHDSLSTAIQLASQPREDVDPALLARTTAEAVVMLREVRTGQLFRWQKLTTLAVLGLLAAASIAAMATLQPAVAHLWIRRLALFSDDHWPRRVSLAIDDFSDGFRKVARGSDVDVIVRVRLNGAAELSDADYKKKLPSIIDLRSHSSTGWRSERMGMRGGTTDKEQAFGHVLKNVGEDLMLEVRGGDARISNLSVKVIDPPSLEKLSIHYTPPTYLGGGKRQVPPSRIVQVPRGSSVEIECTSTKPLSAATLLATIDKSPSDKTVGPQQTEEVLSTLTAENSPATSIASRSLAGRIESLTGDRTIIARFTDSDQLVNREPIAFVLSALPDDPPLVTVRMRGISTAVTPRARIPLDGTIVDDHGLEEAVVRLTVVDGAETAFPIARLKRGASLIDLPTDAPEVVPLEALALSVGSALKVAVTAVDGCTLDGAPNSGTSDVWSLDVVTPELLLAMLEAREILLRRRYESCIADFTQTRNRLAATTGSTPNEPDAKALTTSDDGDLPADTAMLSESTSRARGEVDEIATAFREIHRELDNNLLLTPELELRLIVQIADPLAAIATKDLPDLSLACRSLADQLLIGNRASLLARADLVLARMRAVLDKMMELESFNEVIEILRGVIRTQEEIKTNTLEWQKKRAREALERP